MRKGSVVTSVVSSAMLIISATFFVSYEAEARPTSEMLSTTMVAACSVTCYACGPLVSHGTQADPGGLHLGNWHQDCIPGYCADTHPDCPGFFSLDASERDKVWQSLVRGKEREKGGAR